MNKKHTNIFLLLLVSIQLIHAEAPEKKEHNYIVFGVPQYIISNGLRVDLDLHHKESPNWLILSPYYYFDHQSVDLMNLGGSQNYYDSYTYDKMVGAGLGISRRTFLTKESVSRGFYLQYGATYKYFDINGNNYTWVEITGTDGLPYQEMHDIKYYVYIHSISANAIVGYQTQLLPSLYIDIYVGFGVKYSIHHSPEHVTVKYNRGVDDFGYTGTQMVGGIRFGIGL
jgi:hypothetical protein